MTKHSVDGLLVSLLLFMQFSTCILAQLLLTKSAAPPVPTPVLILYSIGMKFLHNLLQ